MERVCKKALPGLTMADGRQTESMADKPEVSSLADKLSGVPLFANPMGVANPGVFFISTVNVDE